MVQVTILAVFVAYLIVMLGIGYYFQKTGMEDLEDVFLAGKGAPWYLVAMSFFATAIGAGGTIGLVAGTFESQSITEFWSYGITLAGSFVVAFVLGPLLPRTKNITIPSLLEDRYDEKTRAAAVPFYILRFVSTLGAQWLAAGTILSFMFADLLTVTQGAIIGAIFITIYTMLGGMGAVMWTDFIQGTLLFVGLWVVAFISIGNFGGLSAMTAEVTAVAPQAFDLFALNWTLIVAYIITLVPSLLVRQGYLQRIMSARSPRDGFVGANLNGIIGFAYIPVPLLIGAMALITYTNIDNPQLILPNMVVDVLPTWIAAIILSALAAAVMSSGDSFLLSGASNFVDDIYLRYFAPDASNQKQRLASRVAIAGLMVGSLVLAVAIPNIIDLIVFGALALTGGVLVPWLAAFYWPRGTTDGAFWSLVIGAAATVVWWWAGYFAGVSEYLGLHPIYIGLPLSIILFFVISFAQEPEYEKALETARKHNLKSLEKRTLRSMGRSPEEFSEVTTDD